MCALCTSIVSITKRTFSFFPIGRTCVESWVSINTHVSSDAFRRWGEV